MRDMFIQSQQLVSNSSSNTGSIPKKRKAEHCNIDQFVQQGSAYELTNSNSIVQSNNARPDSQQPFVHASTIKLLDTYQRCGQKVSHLEQLNLDRKLLYLYTLLEY